MGKNISVHSFKSSRVAEQRVELVERKGLGHPDQIADSVAEEFSRRLSAYYQEEFGTILHHNVDKTLLVGGQSRPEFGGGEVITPILILHAGRATNMVNYDGRIRYVPVARLAVEATKEWVGKSMRFLDPERHVVVDSKINPGSADLVSLFDRGRRVIPLSNDTSFGVGFAPLTQLESSVLELEKYLNSVTFKRKVPESGEDIKIMGLRNGEKWTITIAAAIVAPLTKNFEHYNSIKDEIRSEAEKIVRSRLNSDSVDVLVNTADRDATNAYLTVTGTSAEHGDDGAVGRGNRSCGLITPNRPMSLEAVAGKNPVSHVGKIYNLVSQRIAQKIVDELAVEEVYVKMLSQIGRPIDDPLQVEIEILTNGVSQSVYSSAQSIAEDQISNIQKITEALLRGELQVS